jgi:hypothetical protein
MPKIYFIYKVAGKKSIRAVEIKIKWIKRKQMTHENTYMYRDDK